MSCEWYVVRSGAGEAGWNMALDEALLESADRLGRPVLRFYAWTQRAASFGYFQKYDEVERLTLLRPLVRRPTGGGLVPHEADWTYSVSFPTTHGWYDLPARESYRRVHAWVGKAFERAGVSTRLAPAAQKTAPGQCFAGYEESDLLWRGTKIAGAAQRRRREGLLIQGSVQPPMNGPARRQWEEAMCASLASGVKELEPDLELRRRAEELRAEKYSREEYNRRR